MGRGQDIIFVFSPFEVTLLGGGRERGSRVRSVWIIVLLLVVDDSGVFGVKIAIGLARRVCVLCRRLVLSSEVFALNTFDLRYLSFSSCSPTYCIGFSRIDGPFLPLYLTAPGCRSHKMLYRSSEGQPRVEHNP